MHGPRGTLLSCAQHALGLQDGGDGSVYFNVAVGEVALNAFTAEAVHATSPNDN